MLIIFGAKVVSTMKDKDTFLKIISDLVRDKNTFKLIFSKPRLGVELRSSNIEVMVEDDVTSYKILDKSSTQHFTRVLSPNDIEAYIKDALNNLFYYCEIMSERGNGTLLQNQKGTTTFIRKKGLTSVPAVTHNRSKEYYIPEDAPYLIHLGISSKNGKVHEQSTKKYRQINKYIEIIDGLIEPKTKKINIADMGSGKAYLTFSLYYFLTEIRKIETVIIGYELRDELVAECNKIAQQNNFSQLKFEQGNIETLHIDKIDMVVSLHACDIATDMAIHAGLKANAKIIVLAPCCHKQIRKQIELRNGILKHGILLERQSEIITDAIRALVLEDHGYKAKVFEFISQEHTQKNTMIVASKYKKNEHAALEIKDIKETYAIRHHYLEKLIDKLY
jgi:Methyltransferase domain